MFLWLNQIVKARYIFDVMLLVFFIIASAPMATGIAIHEWISFLYLIPFVIHILLHWDWIVSMPKRIFKKLSLENRLNIIWNTLLYILMVIVTVSGILISEAALPLLGITIKPDSFWHSIHHNSSNLLFPFLGIHLALHWGWIVRTTKKVFNKKNSDMSAPLTINEGK
jgi:hypothetical protein